MAVDDSIARLRLFVQRVEKFLSSRFVREVQEQNVGLTMHFEASEDGGSFQFTHTRPDDETIEAVILTWRQFKQGREPVSFRRMAEDLGPRPEVSDYWKTEFAKARAAFRTYLQERIGLVLNGVELDRETLLDVFINGGLAHAEAGKWERYSAWMEDPFTAPITQHYFAGTIASTARFLGDVARLCRGEIERLETARQLSEQNQALAEE